MWFLVEVFVQVDSWREINLNIFHRMKSYLQAGSIDDGVDLYIYYVWSLWTLANVHLSGLIEVRSLKAWIDVPWTWSLG